MEVDFMSRRRFNLCVIKLNGRAAGILYFMAQRGGTGRMDVSRE
jgi:hypothetical protein